MKKSNPCHCERCEELRAQGLKQKFTPEECAEIREYTRQMMSQIREPKKP